MRSRACNSTPSGGRPPSQSRPIPLKTTCLRDSAFSPIFSLADRGVFVIPNIVVPIERIQTPNPSMNRRQQHEAQALRLDTAPPSANAPAPPPPSPPERAPERAPSKPTTPSSAKSTKATTKSPPPGNPLAMCSARHGLRPRPSPRRHPPHNTAPTSQNVRSPKQFTRQGLGGGLKTPRMNGRSKQYPSGSPLPPDMRPVAYQEQILPAGE